MAKSKSARCARNATWHETRRRALPASELKLFDSIYTVARAKANEALQVLLMLPIEGLPVALAALWDSLQRKAKAIERLCPAPLRLQGLSAFSTTPEGIEEMLQSSQGPAQPSQ